MSDTGNPFQTPATDMSSVQNPLPGKSGLTPTMIGYLKAASPWLRFIGIMGFIFVGIIALVGVIMLFAMPSMAAMSGATGAGAIVGAIGGFAGVFYLLMAVLYFFPARFIHGFGSKIRDYLQTGREADLETALKNNKSLWKFIGILTIVGLAMIPVLIIVAIVAAARMM